MLKDTYPTLFIIFTDHSHQRDHFLQDGHLDGNSAQVVRTACTSDPTYVCYQANAVEGYYSGLCDQLPLFP